MKNIVVLVGEYKPNSSTNGNIADNIIQELKKNEYNIIVITRKNAVNLLNEEEIDGVQIYRHNDWNLMIHKYCIDKIKNGKKVFKYLLYIKRIVFYIPRLFRITSISNHYKNKIKKTIKKINKKSKIDAIISVSAPHEEIFAAMEYKKENKDIILLPYQLDRFANANSLYPTKILKKIKMQNNLKLEEKLLKISDKLFVLPPIYPHYTENKIFNNYINKVIVTEHPLLQNLKKQDVNNQNSINILYAGSLDTKLRNPTYLLEILNSDIIKNSNIKLDLYSFGNCQAIIDSYKNKLANILFDKGKVAHDVIVNKMQEANILLSIGNNSNEEVPSKLFEYLSFCKPIIHLYYSDYDVYLEYLKNYKYSICIKMDEEKLKENIKLFYNFCIENSNVNIEYQTVEKIFEKCTPQYVAKKFIKQIEEN